MGESVLRLAFTTYQSGKLSLIGLQEDGRLSSSERTFNRCMGSCVDGGGLYVISHYQLWRFESSPEAGAAHAGFDRLYVFVNGHTTGNLDFHDTAVDRDGRPVLVNTLFSCLATFEPTACFAPLWWPKFVTKRAAEDRCDLNGLAMDGGKPCFVAAVAQMDVADSWRDHRGGGGWVIDTGSSEIVALGLSMPHLRRFYRDILWLHNSGIG